ncbi:MAG: hypothetical protein DRJ42_17875 [Deltaproteobacteria bacterium]|nr:MAG: hypothetical protein DRJ42_17875 [Deltaproteobacteria bacterium]
MNRRALGVAVEDADENAERDEGRRVAEAGGAAQQGQQLPVDLIARTDDVHRVRRAGRRTAAEDPGSEP